MVEKQTRPIWSCWRLCLIDITSLVGWKTTWSNVTICHYPIWRGWLIHASVASDRFRPCGWQKNYRSRRIYRKGHNSWQEVAAGTILWHCKICQEQPKVIISSLRIGWVSRIQRLEKALLWCKVLLDCAPMETRQLQFTAQERLHWKG